MNRPGTWFLLGVALLLLLAAQPQAASAAIPPLQGVEAWPSPDNSTVSFRVYDPSRQKDMYGYRNRIPGLDPNSIVVKDGIVAWIGAQPSARFVEFAIYDPGPGKWQIIEPKAFLTGPWTDPWAGAYAYGLTIQNGVVSWTGPTKPDPKLITTPRTIVSYATYDPQRGAWVTGWSACNTDNPNLQNKDGIIAFKTQSIFSPGSFSSSVDFVIYDPEISNYEPFTDKFKNKGGWLGGNEYGHDYDNKPCEIDWFYIENYSVKIMVGDKTIYRGYDHKNNKWNVPGSTAGLASFLPQPVVGKSPLWVAFWDQSLGAQTCAWVFGDGTVEINKRSIGHIYAQPGYYQVKQLVFGNGSDSMTKSIMVDMKPK